MRLTYFDEVKYQPEKQRYYWLGGVCVTPEAVWRLESAVTALFRARSLTRDASAGDTEFPRRDISIVGGILAGRTFRPIELCEGLFLIIDAESELAKIHVRIEPLKDGSYRL